MTAGKCKKHFWVLNISALELFWVRNILIDLFWEERFWKGLFDTILQGREWTFWVTFWADYLDFLGVHW